MSEVKYDRDGLMQELRWAMDYNPAPFKFEDVAELLAGIEGENDGATWHWLVAMKDGTFAYITGGCDYTGWDCQSGCEYFPTKTLAEAMEATPAEDGDAREVRKTFREQLKNEVPK